MNKEFVRVKVEDHWLWREYPDMVKSETKCKFNRPTPERRYIKILAICLSYATARVIFPNTKQPLMHQVRDLCRAGYLDRFTRGNERRYYYKTTHKGRELLIKAISGEQD